MTLVAHQHIGQVRDALEAQIIADRLGIAIAAITVEMRWSYAVGEMDDDACERWPRWPYRFPWPPPETEWPRDLPDLLTEGNNDA